MKSFVDSRKFVRQFAEEMSMRYLLFKFISITGAMLIGFWLPLRLLGFRLHDGFDIACQIYVLITACANLALHRKSGNRLGLALDAPSLLPWAWIGSAAGVPAVACAFFLMLRHVLRVKAFLDDFGTLRPIVYRLVPLVLMLPILVHFSACGWIALGSGSSGDEGSHFLQYARAFYWAFTTLTTVGYGDIVALTPPQMFYACGVQLIGVGVFGFILSNIASLLSRADAAREHHMDNLDRIETFMHSHTIGTELRGKVRAYYNYLWRHKKGYSDRSLLDGLPAKMQSELFVAINRAIIEKVPLFRDAEPEMIEELMNELEPRVFVPGERIFKIDDPGDALYFIQDGAVEIIGRDGSTIVVLREGAFFGEVALTSAQSRNATAQAMGFCDAYLLHRAAFDRVIQAHPHFREHIESAVAHRKNT